MHMAAGCCLGTSVPAVWLSSPVSSARNQELQTQNGASKIQVKDIWYTTLAVTSCPFCHIGVWFIVMTIQVLLFASPFWFCCWCPTVFLFLILSELGFCVAVCLSFFLPLTPVCPTLFLWILSTSSQTISHQSHHPCCPSTWRQFLLFMMISLFCHLYDIKPMDLNPFLLAVPAPCCKFFLSLHRLTEPPCFYQSMIPISFRV